MQWLPQQRVRMLVVIGGAVIGLAGLAAVLRAEDESALAERIRCGSAPDCIEAIKELEARQAASAAEVLIETARSQRPQVAAAAILSLGRMTSDPAPRRQAIVEALGRPESNVRRAAVVSYGRVFPVGQAAESEKVVDVLRRDPDTAVRCAAARSLGRLHVFDALPALLDSAEDASADLRGQAVASTMKILCIDFDYDPNASPEARQAVTDRLRRIARRPAVRAMHADWLKHRRR